MSSTLHKSVGAIGVAFIVLLFWQILPATPPEWRDSEMGVLRSLWLDSLTELPRDPTNAVADNAAAARFGEQLFRDPRMSVNGGISCSTCHQPIRRFTDGLQKGQAIGTSRRNTPSIVGASYSPWQYWDGRRDSQWAQALSPLQDPNEHATDRDQVVRLISEDPVYQKTYAAIFGESPDRRNPDVNKVFADIGKAIAAFERTVMPTTSRFDEYVAAVISGDSATQNELFSNDEIWGLRLFIGEANCVQCHNGPLLTNNEFHNTGVISFPGEVPDRGRAVGVLEVLGEEFNCMSRYSDDERHRCVELEFARTGAELIGAMRTPSLRNLDNTAPYMHKGQLATLADVLRHYNDAPGAMIGHNEAKPLSLSSRQLRQLEAFLLTLAAPISNSNSEL